MTSENYNTLNGEMHQTGMKA